MYIYCILVTHTVEEKESFWIELFVFEPIVFLPDLLQLVLAGRLVHLLVLLLLLLRLLQPKHTHTIAIQWNKDRCTLPCPSREKPDPLF